MDSPFVLGFVLLNGLLIGTVLTIAIQHALAHYRDHHGSKLPPVHRPEPPAVHVPPEMKDRLLAQAQARFIRIVDNSAHHFESQLQHVADQLSHSLERQSTTLLERQEKKLEVTLAAIQTQTESARKSAEEALEAYKAELSQSIEAEVTAEKNQRLALIDEKLSEAVVAFLNDTLRYEADMGAQLPYVLAQLEAHKNELKEGLRPL